MRPVINRLEKRNNVWQFRPVLKTFRGRPFGEIVNECIRKTIKGLKPIPVYRNGRLIGFDYSEILIPFEFNIQRFAGTPWYVDKDASGNNDGTSWENAWENLGDIAWGSISPSDSIDFKNNNVYTATLTIGASGSSGNPITLNFNEATFNVGSGADQIDVNGKNYIIINDPVFHNSITAFGYLIHFSSASDNIIIDGAYFDPTNNTAIFAIYGRASNLTVQNTTLRKILQGCVGTTTNCHDILIKNSWLETSDSDDENIADLIKYGDAYNVTIEGNKLVMKKRNSTPHCDIIQNYLSGAGESGNPYNWVIRYNWLEMNTDATNNRSWMMIEDMTGNLKIYANILLGIDGAESGNGIRIKTGTGTYNVYIYHNTFVRKQGPGNFMSIDDTGNLYLKNNIGYDSGEGTIIGGNMSIVNDYNSWYGGSATGYRGTACASFKGVNSVCNQDPLFIDYANNNFGLQSGSPCKGAGINLGAEYNQGIRPGACWPNPNLNARINWDQGAFEDIGDKPVLILKS